MRRALPVLVPGLAVVLLPLLVDARGGADVATVFAVAWVVAVAVSAAGTVVVACTARPVALERALTVVVPMVVVVLVGSPWILAVAGRHARDTGVGTLVLLALAAVPYTVAAVAAFSAAARGRVPAAVVPSAAAVLVAMAVTWVLLPAVGVLGAGFGWLLGWSGAAVITLRHVLSIRPDDDGARNPDGRTSLIDTGR